MIYTEQKVYRFAIACGLIPLLLGLAIFGTWVLTRAAFLQPLGLVVIALGVVAFFAGAYALLLYHSLASRNPHHTPPQVARASRLGWLALLINFPVAYAILSGVTAIESCYTVHAQNQSKLAFEDIRISGGGYNEALGNIAPGEKTRYRLYFDHEGEVEISAKHRGERIKATLDGYTTLSLGGSADVTFQADGTILVQHPER